MENGKSMTVRYAALMSRKENGGKPEVEENNPTTPLISEEQLKAKLTESLAESLLGEGKIEKKGDEVVQTPPPSPTEAGSKKDPQPSVFSVAQVSIKLNELWSTAKETIYGETYWIPTDVYEVFIFPHQFLKNHKTMYPPSEGNDDATLRVVQGTLKKENSDKLDLNHVVFSRNIDDVRETLSLFRTQDLSEAMDFCRRCEECRALFKLLINLKDIRRQVRDLTKKFQAHPLWRMVHIAIACGRTDVFNDDGFEFLQKMGYHEDDLTKPVASPEGKHPLMLAIETNQPDIVNFLIKIGADVTARDTDGNNCMHYAALASTQMIEIIWAVPSAKELLNSLNNDRNTPALLAIRNANPFCLKVLMNLGADMSIRIAGKNPLFEAVQSKGKTIEVIRAILEAQPDIISDTEEATGNTVLHAALYKLPLMGVLNLRRKELDLNARNKAGQTALHLYTSRGEMGMIITIASYGCDMNARDQSGNTALHIAVSKNFLNLTRLLLCLGSDPNTLNYHGDSPRHLAAKLNEVVLLRSLIMCGATRCSHSKSGCVSGCVNERSIRFLSKSHSTASTDGQIKPSPRAFAAIEEIESKKEQIADHPWNKFQGMEHKEIYESMLRRLSKMVENKEENVDIINVLTLDGGGIRGLVIMQILIEIERIMGEPIWKYFDWIAGTSTGALVAAALSLGKSLRDCQMIYLRFKDLIFDGWVRPYKATILETFIKAEMGEETLMSQILWPRLMFTTTRADVFPVQLEFLRNYRLPISEEDNQELGFLDPKELHLWKALRRSSAAPTYFSCVDNKYIDGGIVSNNPTLDLLSEVQLYNSTCRYAKRANTVQIGCLVSIGTGVIPTIPMNASQLDISSTNPYSSAVAIKNLGVILVDQVTATDGVPVSRAASWCVTRETPYFRLSAPLHKDIAMDTRDDDVLAKMMWDCMEYTYKHQPYIEKICTLLKKIGIAESRRDRFADSRSSTEMGTQTSRPPSPSTTTSTEND
ncbi:Phospholipase A(2) [Aphelenchoides besseyi]|nr:Phospholipase A(2) [Aphelenchoides besseyi]